MLLGSSYSIGLSEIVRLVLVRLFICFLNLYLKRKSTGRGTNDTCIHYHANNSKLYPYGASRSFNNAPYRECDWSILSECHVIPKRTYQETQISITHNPRAYNELPHTSRSPTSVAIYLEARQINQRLFTL